MGLLFALASCFFALSQNLNLSVIFLVLAGICDLFDGAVARKIKRTDAEKEFGIQLDTVVDVVNFGIAPMIIAFSNVSAIWYALVIYAFYIIAAVVRLSFYNTTAAPNTRTKYYQGLPVTYIALVLPIILLFGNMLLSLVALLVMGLLFIMNVKIPKPKGIWYLLFPVIAIALIIVWSIL